MKASAYIKARMAKGLCKADAEAEARDMLTEGLEDDAGLGESAGVPAALVAQALQDLGLDAEAIKKLSEFAVVNGLVADDGSVAPATADAAAATVDAVVADTPAQEAEGLAADAQGAEPVAVADANIAAEAAKDEEEDMKTAEFEGAMKGAVKDLGAAFTAAIAPVVAKLDAIASENATMRKGLADALTDIAAVRKGMDGVQRPGRAPEGGTVRPAPGDAPAAGDSVVKGDTLTIEQRVAIGQAAHRFHAMHADPGIKKAHLALESALMTGAPDAQVIALADQLKIAVPA